MYLFLFILNTILCGRQIYYKKQGKIKITKIKVLKFRMSDYTNMADQENERNGILEIEKIINDFIWGKDIIDIKVNAIDVNYHNNGRNNTIDLIYTILYRVD